ncbi:hypothetical protein MRX96_035735 [Rhipicephalus microplus]
MRYGDSGRDIAPSASPNLGPPSLLEAPTDGRACGEATFRFRRWLGRKRARRKRPLEARCLILRGARILGLGIVACALGGFLIRDSSELQLRSAAEKALLEGSGQRRGTTPGPESGACALRCVAEAVVCSDFCIGEAR